MKFPLGRILATPKAIRYVGMPQIFDCIRRHSRGDWGDIAPDDRGLNELALQEGNRILSVYHIKDNGLKPTFETLWIITEADRSATTALLPDEY